jgi:hypothetical protein
MGNGAVIVMVFVLSLFFSSLAISYLNVEFNGDTSVKTINLPTRLDKYYGEQDYISGKFNASIVDLKGVFNNWEFVNNVGMVHTSVGSFLSFLTGNYLYLDTIQPTTSNTVTNYYVINNSIKKDFSIVLLGTGSDDHNELIIKQDGIHIPNYFQAFGIITGDAYFIPIANANQYEEVRLKTYYYIGDSDNIPSGSIIFNEVEYPLYNLHAKKSSVIDFKTYYAGISSNDVGTTLETFRSDNTMSETSGGSVTDSLKAIASFLTFVISMLTYSLPENVLPLYLQVIVILPQEFMMFIGFIMVLREG